MNISQDERNQMRELRERGASYRSIASRFGIDHPQKVKHYISTPEPEQASSNQHIKTMKIQLDNVVYFKMHLSSVRISLLEGFTEEIKKKYKVTDLIKNSEGNYLIELTERSPFDPPYRALGKE